MFINKAGRHIQSMIQNHNQGHTKSSGSVQTAIAGQNPKIQETYNETVKTGTSTHKSKA